MHRSIHGVNVSYKAFWESSCAAVGEYYNTPPRFMGQQTNKIQKRRRRKAYIVRKKLKAAAKSKPKAKAPAKKAAPAAE